MEVTVSRWYENSAVVERGPLVYALKMNEKWEKKAFESDKSDVYGKWYYEVTSDSPWNYALPARSFSPDRIKDAFTVEKSDITTPIHGMSRTPHTHQNEGNATERLDASQRLGRSGILLHAARQRLWRRGDDRTDPLRMHDPPDYGISGKMIRLSIPPHVRPTGRDGSYRKSPTFAALNYLRRQVTTTHKPNLYLDIECFAKFLYICTLQKKHSQGMRTFLIILLGTLSLLLPGPAGRTTFISATIPTNRDCRTTRFIVPYRIKKDSCGSGRTTD